MELQEREQIMQITTSWKEEGRIEGRLEEKRAIALRLLNRKLGNLSEEISRQIKSLEPSQLDTLTEDLLDFQTLDDLERWLSNS
jgi:predicted transposase YdaD